MYSILDPSTKILSLLPSKTSKKAYAAISLADGRVIYGGEVPRLSTSANGGKQKSVKMHSIELTVPPRHRKHYLATGDKELTMGWIRDLAKVMHLGADKERKTQSMLRRQVGSSRPTFTPAFQSLLIGCALPFSLSLSLSLSPSLSLSVPFLPFPFSYSFLFLFRSFLLLLLFLGGPEEGRHGRQSH